MRHLLSLRDIGAEQLTALVDNSLAIARECATTKRSLAGKVVGIYFKKTSTRTRTAFTVGAIHLGAGIITYGPYDLQINTGESIPDTARVLSGFLDILVIRTNEPIAETQAFASQDKMAIINAMSEDEHPTQAIADLVTIKEAFGHLNDIHVLYLGEGNNSASALALAVSQTPGMRLTVIAPEGYGLKSVALKLAANLAKRNGAVIEQHHGMDHLPSNVDVVYTTRWQTMGEPKADADWHDRFLPYRVTSELMSYVSKPAGTIFLHDLPAIRGSEVVDEILDGPQSHAFRQAQHKMSSAMAVLAWCVDAI